MSEKSNRWLVWRHSRLASAETCFSQVPIPPVTSLSALGLPQIQTLPLTLVQAAAPTAPTPAAAPVTSSTPALSQVCRLDAPAGFQDTLLIDPIKQQSHSRGLCGRGQDRVP